MQSGSNREEEEGIVSKSGRESVGGLVASVVEGRTVWNFIISYQMSSKFQLLFDLGGHPPSFSSASPSLLLSNPLLEACSFIDSSTEC